MFTHCDKIHERDRQTDGRTLQDGIGRSTLSLFQAQILVDITAIHVGRAKGKKDKGAYSSQ